MLKSWIKELDAFLEGKGQCEPHLLPDEARELRDTMIALYAAAPKTWEKWTDVYNAAMTQIEGDYVECPRCGDINYSPDGPCHACGR